MKSRAIVFCYRKIIDVSSSQPWEKMVFDDSYLEFCMQFQNFNTRNNCFTFSELSRQRADAEHLHFLVSPSVSGYIPQLKGKIPDVLDNLGKQFLSFNSYRFELINSDIRNVQSHQVAINFYSSTMSWHDTIGNFLLLSADSGEDINTEEEVHPHLYQLQPFVSIHTLKLKP